MSVYGRLIRTPNIAQPWHWNVASSGNHETLAKSSENYVNRADCIRCFDLVCDRKRVPLYEFKDGKTASLVTD